MSRSMILLALLLAAPALGQTPEAPAGAQTPDAPAEAAPEAPAAPAPEASAEPATEAVETAAPARRRGRDDTVHIAMRWGMRLHLDPAFDAVAEHRNHLAIEIAVDVRLWHRLALGLSFTGSGAQGELYGHDTAWQDNSLFLAAVYRHRFPGLGLATYGRLGPTVHWYDLTLGGDLGPGEQIERDPWQFGARAAIGLEFWPISPDYIRRMGAFGFGVVLEGYYDQAFVGDWTDGGVDPGPFDPSGPGWSLGVISRF